VIQDDKGTPLLKFEAEFYEELDKRALLTIEWTRERR
jgi:hypothetical protein